MTASEYQTLLLTTAIFSISSVDDFLKAWVKLLTSERFEKTAGQKMEAGESGMLGRSVTNSHLH
jgi:hypothetical protein